MHTYTFSLPPLNSVKWRSRKNSLKEPDLITVTLPQSSKFPRPQRRWRRWQWRQSRMKAGTGRHHMVQVPSEREKGVLGWQGKLLKNPYSSLNIITLVTGVLFCPSPLPFSTPFGKHSRKQPQRYFSHIQRASATYTHLPIGHKIFYRTAPYRGTSWNLATPEWDAKCM